MCVFFPVFTSRLTPILAIIEASTFFHRADVLVSIARAELEMFQHYLLQLE